MFVSRGGFLGQIRFKWSTYFGKIYIIGPVSNTNNSMYYTKNPCCVIWRFLGHLEDRGSRYLSQMILKTLPVSGRINSRIHLFCTPTHCRVMRAQTDGQTDGHSKIYKRFWNGVWLYSLYSNALLAKA